MENTAKIFVYSFREFDEAPFFEQYGKEFGAELKICREIPRMENLSLAEGYPYISILTNPIDRPMMEQLAAQGVRMISTRTVGYDHVDLAAAREFGISVSNASYPSESVAEYAVMMMLMALRKMKRILERASINDFSLPGNLGCPLRHRKVGILGTGRIGCEVAKILSGFGCEVLAYDLYHKEGMEHYFRYVDLDTLLSSCDVISLHMPLDESNFHMIDADAIAKMPQGTVVVNTARGGLIDTKALIAGLESGHLGGAALDVIEGEFDMYYFDRKSDVIDKHDLFILRGFPNVFVTPHMAFYTDLTVRHMVKSSVESCVLTAQGKANPWKVL